MQSSEFLASVPIPLDLPLALSSADASRGQPLRPARPQAPLTVVHEVVGTQHAQHVRTPLSTHLVVAPTLSRSVPARGPRGLPVGRSRQGSHAAEPSPHAAAQP
jgi:hypothetical protein